MQTHPKTVLTSKGKAYNAMWHICCWIFHFRSVFAERGECSSGVALYSIGCRLFPFACCFHSVIPVLAFHTHTGRAPSSMLSLRISVSCVLTVVSAILKIVAEARHHREFHLIIRNIRAAIAKIVSSFGGSRANLLSMTKQRTAASTGPRL